MIKGIVTGDRELVTKLTRMPGNLQGNLVKVITRLCIKLSANVKQGKLSGQVLGVRSGRLRRSITSDVSTSGINSVNGTVGTNLAYGRFWELGFHGTETVREHLRKIREHGKMALRSSPGHDMKVWTKKRGKLTGDEAVVREHSRRVDIPAHSFLGSALKEMTPEVMADINKAVEESIK